MMFVQLIFYLQFFIFIVGIRIFIIIIFKSDEVILHDSHQSFTWFKGFMDIIDYINSITTI